ncbi:hypothetical protein F4819DRAFT_489264 [Hypoxylon fuscum]|nr:hypothetical protein F4819DRAFT_489264 [Hypoxylon fuscum]
MSSSTTYAQAAKGQSAMQTFGSQSSATESQAPSTTSVQSRDAAPTPSTRAPSVAISTSSNEVDGSQNTRSSSVKPESLKGNDADSISAIEKATQTSNPSSQGTERVLGEVAPHGAEKRGRGRGQTLTSQATDAGDGKKGRKGKKGKAAEKDGDQPQEDKKENVLPKPELSDAPLPTVNPWAQRAAKLSATPSNTTQSRNTHGAVAGQVSNAIPQDQGKQKPLQNGVDANVPHSRPASSGMKPQKKDAEQSRINGNQSSRRPAPRGARAQNGEDRSTFEAPSTVVNNTSSWPTPETAASGPKAQANSEKPEKDEKDEAGPSKPRHKQNWVQIPFVPTAKFETPLPSRGGRGGRASGSRGGREGGAARGNHTANDATSTERTQDMGANSGTVPVATPTSKRPSVDAPASRDSRKPQNQAGTVRPSGETSSTSSKADTSKQNPADSVHGVASQAYPVRTGSSNQRADENVKPSQAARDSGINGAKDASYQGQSNVSRNDRTRGGARGRGGHSAMNGVAHPQAQFGQSPAGYGFNLRHPNYGFTQMPYGNPFPGQVTGSHHRSRPSSGSSRSQGAPRHQPSRLSPFSPVGMFDPTMFPLSNSPYAAFNEPQQVMQTITQQVEYYFSINNLLKDMYLRRFMDSQGFVDLNVIATFRRMTEIAQDYHIIRIACENSPHIQLVVTEDGYDKVRRREKWQDWVLDMNLRHPSAQHNGPTRFQAFSSQGPYIPHVFAYGGEAPAPIFSPAGMDSQYSHYMNGNMVPSPTSNGVNEVNGHPRPSESQLSATVPEFSPTGNSGMGIADQHETASTNANGNELKLDNVSKKATAVSSLEGHNNALPNGSANHEEMGPTDLSVGPSTNGINGNHAVSGY